MDQISSVQFFVSPSIFQNDYIHWYFFSVLIQISKLFNWLLPQLLFSLSSNTSQKLYIPVLLIHNVSFNFVPTISSISSQLLLFWYSKVQLALFLSLSLIVPNCAAMLLVLVSWNKNYDTIHGMRILYCSRYIRKEIKNTAPMIKCKVPINSWNLLISLYLVKKWGFNIYLKWNCWKGNSSSLYYSLDVTTPLNLSVLFNLC